MKNVSKIRILYHANCRDGFAAAWAARRLFGHNAEYVPLAHGKIPDGFPFKDEGILFLDICLPREQMLEIQKNAAFLKVYDHHKTAEADLLDFPAAEGTSVVFDMDRSGAGIAWDVIHRVNSPTCYECGARATVSNEHQPGCPVRRPWFIDYVEDRDLWKFALPDSKPINAFIGTLKLDFKEWDHLEHITPLAATAAGLAVERKVSAYASEVTKNARMIHTDFGMAAVVNAPQVDISETLAHLLEIRPEADFSVGWWQRADGLFQHGLRSRPDSDIDVSVIAKTFGGGGHQHAAGFQADAPAWIKK